MSKRSNGRAALRLVLTMVACSVASLTMALPAQGSEPIAAFTVASSSSVAGDHPDLRTSFALASPGSPEAAKNVNFSTPTGVFGNSNAITQCSSSDFALNRCPSASQAGLITLHASYEGDPNYLLGTAPIYDLEPGSHTALFAFIVPTLGIPIQIPVAVRTGGDYGLRFTVQDITQLTPLASADLTFWGFPADSGHDGQRFAKGSPGLAAGCPGLADTGCITKAIPAAISVHPLIDNPTTCTGQPLTVSLRVVTYQDPGHSSIAEESLPPITGCEGVTFKPVLFAGVTTSETDAPSGLDVELSDPLPLGFASTPSEIKSAAVELPPGLTINPDAADGQSECLDAQANFGSEGPAECPDNAKIGTFSIGSPSLSEPLQGSVYIGEPKPGDQYRLFMIASGFGINAKLVGSVSPDPSTGKVTVFFNDLPQAPFEDFQLHLFSGERALMATPIACTFYPVIARFTAWDSALPDQNSEQGFGLSSGPHDSECPGQVRPFNPSLAAGTSNSNAGAFSSFTLKLDREDGDQFLGKLNFTLPPGLTADLRGITYCPETAISAAIGALGRAEQAQPSCPASSQIGSTNVAAGPGSHPFHAIGSLFLAGPFRGAPLSLVAITPALAGPYDYGTVVVRVAVHINPLDAHVVADSETVPEIIGGIPIRMRSIQVHIDKPNFMINPTNCDPFAVVSQGIGDQGTVADFSSYFHAVNCFSLGFAPKLTIRQLGSRKQTRRAQDPSLQFDLHTRPGDANISSVAVTLPKAVAIDQRHLGNICSKAQLAAERCAGRQAIGTVTTTTPLLDQPLTGPAYAVSGFGNLPHVVFILDGQVLIMPEAKSSSVQGGHLKTVVPVVPDAPIGHFRLIIFGGKHGYLSNTRDICRHTPRVGVVYTAQNGKTRSETPRIGTACGRSVARDELRRR